MTDSELNKFIKHYIEHDKTRRAIMLTASWGTGKSYYINNVLKPFLSKKENGNYTCIVVSLYGVNSISEINKAIYLEIKWNSIINCIPKRLRKKFKKIKESKSEIKSTIQIGTKTIFRGVTSFFGIDLSTNEKGLSKLYESINLSNCLIILEDIERSGLEVLDVLGYVNSLVENDGAKMLLVANENEILSYEYSDNDKKQKQLDEKSLQYLISKEKAVGDTVYYSCDFRGAIKTIISLFENITLAIFENDEYVEDILDIMRLEKCYNLRTFIFACQKASDIFNVIQKDDMSFNKTIFYSIIAFSMMITNGYIPPWDGTELVSPNLGVSKYPLYRFCYNYIRWQNIDTDEIETTLEAHKRMVLFDKHGSNNDSDLNIIYAYYEHTEQEVQEALNRIEKRLSNSDDIPFYDYRKLAFYLISCHTVLGYDYTSCKAKMIKNITGKSLDIDSEMLFIPISEFNDDSEKELYHNFIDELKEALYKDTVEPFSYKPEDLNEFCDQLLRYKDNNHAFISKFDMDKLVNMLFMCSSAQLQTFREKMFSAYRHADINEYSDNDISAMKMLKERIKEKLSSQNVTLDKIVLHQFRWIIENIDSFTAHQSSNV